MFKIKADSITIHHSFTEYIGLPRKYHRLYKFSADVALPATNSQDIVAAIRATKPLEIDFPLIKTKLIGYARDAKLEYYSNTIHFVVEGNIEYPCLTNRKRNITKI